MSTYVVSMIEVRQGGEWELLKEFRRSDYMACAVDGLFPKDLTWEMRKVYLEEKEEEKVIGYIENTTHFAEDYHFQDFLLNTDLNNGFIETDLGMPEDASKEAIKKYKEYGNNASIPSYFYLTDIVASYKELLDEFMNKKIESANHHQFNLINEKLDRILDEQNIKHPKTNSLEEFSDYEHKMWFSRIIDVYSEICRIRTLVESQYGSLKSTDIRVIWFIY